jgi:hypothetical protein
VRIKLALGVALEGACLSTPLNSVVLRRVSLAQLIRFVVVELTHSCSNSRFDMDVVFMINYYFSGSRRPRQQ